MADILVVDDEIGIRELLSEILGDEGHEVLQAENAAQARSARLAARPDLVLLDIWMPDTDGIALLREWSEAGLLDMPVIMMSGHATVEMAAQATRLGAVGFLEKPIALQKLLVAVQKGLQGTASAGLTTSPLSAQVTIVKSPTPYPGHSAIAEAKSDAFDRTMPGELARHTSGHAPLPDAFVRQGWTATSPQQATANAGSAGAPLHGASMATPISAVGSPWSLSAPVDQENTSPTARLAQLSLDQPLREARDAFERLYFEHHLAREGGSMTRVAERTGLERTHLYRKLKQLGVELARGARRD